MCFGVCFNDRTVQEFNGANEKVFDCNRCADPKEFCQDSDPACNAPLDKDSMAKFKAGLADMDKTEELLPVWRLKPSTTDESGWEGKHVKVSLNQENSLTKLKDNAKYVGEKVCREDFEGWQVEKVFDIDANRKGGWRDNYYMNKWGDGTAKSEPGRVSNLFEVSEDDQITGFLKADVTPAFEGTTLDVFVDWICSKEGAAFSGKAMYRLLRRTMEASFPQFGRLCVGLNPLKADLKPVYGKWGFVDQGHSNLMQHCAPYEDRETPVDEAAQDSEEEVARKKREEEEAAEAKAAAWRVVAEEKKDSDGPVEKSDAVDATICEGWKEETKPPCKATIAKLCPKSCGV